MRNWKKKTFSFLKWKKKFLLEEQIRLKDLLIYGKKSEEITQEDKTQAKLFNEVEDAAFHQNIEIESETEVKTHKRKKRGKTIVNRLSEDLPTREVIYDILENERKCGCGAELKEIDRIELWLFSTLSKGAESSAVLNSIVETVKLYDMNVLHYLYYIFENIPYAKSEEDYEKLLPWDLSKTDIIPEQN